VLVVVNAYPPDVIGGYELGCRQAVDALRRRDHDVEVLTSSPRQLTPAQAGIRRRLRLADVFGESLTAIPDAARVLREADASLVTAHNVYGLAAAIEERNPDVAYLWNLTGIGGLGILGFLEHVGLPWVWHLMDRVPAQLCEVRGTLVPAVARQLGARMSGAFICCSQGLATEITGQGVDLGSRVEVLPNWVEGPRPAARTRHFRPGAHLRMAFAGQVISLKGADIVIEAAAQLRQEGHFDFSIDLYGPVHEPRFQYAIDAAGLSDAVHLRGALPQSELIDLYDGYDLFLFPTHRREPFGFAPLEAASRGCVALISDDCGIAEWLVDGVHVLKAQRFANDFATVIRDVLEGRIDLGPLARVGADVVWRDFEVDGVMARVEALLLQAATGPRRPGGSAAEGYRLAVLAERIAQTALLEHVMSSPEGS
jgi:glycosyltransferase involved in cell wall biosynthesis